MARAQRIRPVDTNPFDAFTDLDLLLFRQGGLISRRQALRLHSRAAVEHRLVTGQWRLAHRGVYLTTGEPDLDDTQRRGTATTTYRSSRLSIARPC